MEKKNEITAYSKLSAENVFRVVFSKCFTDNQISEKPQTLDFISVKEFKKVVHGYENYKLGFSKLSTLIFLEQNQTEFIQKEALKKVLTDICRDIHSQTPENLKNLKFDQILDYCSLGEKESTHSVSSISELCFEEEVDNYPESNFLTPSGIRQLGAVRNSQNTHLRKLSTGKPGSSISFMDILRNSKMASSSSKNRNIVSSIKFKSIIQNDDSSPEGQEFKIKDGALELFENIFGDKLDETKPYEKDELIEIAIMFSENNEDREPLILELLDNIFEMKEKMNKQEIIKAIIEQIKDDQYFNESNAFSEQIQENIELKDIEVEEEQELTPEQEEPKNNEESEFQIMAEKAQSSRRPKATSIYSTGKHIELLNLNKKRFTINSHSLDEIKAKNLFNYSQKFTNQINFDELEDLLIEIQEMLPQNNDDQYTKMRLSEILVTLFHHIDMLDQNAKEKEKQESILKQDMHHIQSQLQELTYQKDHVNKKHRFSLSYNEQLIAEMTHLENENKNLAEQTNMFLKENEEMKDQMQLMEFKISELMRENEKTPETTQIIQMVNPDIKYDISQYQQTIDELNKEIIQIKMRHRDDVQVYHKEKQVYLSELKQHKSNLNFLSTENEVLNLKIRSLEDQVQNQKQIPIEKMQSTNTLLGLEVDNEYVQDHRDELVLSSRSQSENDYLMPPPQSVPTTRSHPKSQAHQDLGVSIFDLNEIIQQSNQRFKSTFNYMNGSDFSDLFSEVPKLDSAASYQQFAFTLIKQQDFMLNQISSAQQQIEKLHHDYQEEIKKLRNCQNCAALYQKIEKLQKKTQKVKTIKIEVDRKEKKVVTPGKPPINSGLKKHNASFIESTDSRKSKKTQKSHQKKFLPTYSQFTPKNFRLYLENDDYKEKLKYLQVKNDNIKSMYQLQNCISEEKLKRLHHRKLIIQSGQIRSANVSRNSSFENSRNNTVQKINSTPAGNQDFLVPKKQIYLHSDDDARVSNDFEERHNHPVDGQKNQQELELLKNQILVKKDNYNHICKNITDGGVEVRQILGNINKRILEQKMGPKTSMQENFERSTIDLVALQNEKVKLYTEKVQFYNNKKLEKALIVMFGSTLYITNVDGSTNPLFDSSFDVTQDIKQIHKCIKSYKREKHQMFSISFKKQIMVEKGLKQQHVVMVSSERNQFQTLIDYINYQKYTNKQKELIVNKHSPYEKIENSFSFDEIRYYQPENIEKPKLIILKQMQGKFSNHWVNCEMQLIKPNEYALEIIEKIKNDENVEYDLEMIVILNGVKKAEVQKMFKYQLQMKIGAANISKNVVETVELETNFNVTKVKENQVQIMVKGKSHVFQADEKFYQELKSIQAINQNYMFKLRNIIREFQSGSKKFSPMKQQRQIHKTAPKVSIAKNYQTNFLGSSDDEEVNFRADQSIPHEIRGDLLSPLSSTVVQRERSNTAGRFNCMRPSQGKINGLSDLNDTLRLKNKAITQNSMGNSIL